MNQRYIVTTCFALMLMCAASVNSHAQEVKLKKLKVDERVEVQIPVDFVPMEDAETAVKYPSYRRPLAMYASPDNYANYGVNVSENNWMAKDLELLKKFYVSTIKSLHTEIVFYQDTIREINGKKFIVFEYKAKVSQEDSDFAMVRSSGSKHYSYILYTVTQGLIYVFNFQCPLQMREQWQPVARQLAEKVVVASPKKSSKKK